MCDMFPPTNPVHHLAELNLLKNTRLLLASGKPHWPAVAVVEADSHAVGTAPMREAATLSPVGYRSSVELEDSAPVGARGLVAHGWRAYHAMYAQYVGAR